jgi:hypothetical protein
VIGREANLERTPFAVSEGDPHFARLDVQVEGPRVGSEKDPMNVGDFRLDSLSKPTAMPFSEREGDACSDDGVLTGELMDKGPVAREPRESALGGFPGNEGLPKDLIREQAIVCHEGE